MIFIARSEIRRGPHHTRYLPVFPSACQEGKRTGEQGGIVEKSHALMLLRRVLGDPEATLRPGQWEAIDALVNHRRKLLVAERTGWG